uniref:Uncharacterized protein n=1 Tax=viral metagenome TaxID=1070528 RepID=A0A6C0AP67_9ZZZZ
MVVYDTPHHLRTYTRKSHGRSLGQYIRKEENRPKGSNHIMKKHTIKPFTLSNASSRMVKTVLTKNETRRRKANRKAKERKAIVALINNQDILDNIGVYINKHGKLVSIEGEITDDQYNLLLEELEDRLDTTNNDDYAEKIIDKAIDFVEDLRAADIRNHEVNHLTTGMADL